jgi:penicillin V acylase-like amidase (Ntn superfamily)
MKFNKQKISALFFMAIMFFSNSYQAVACTRVVYEGPNGNIITGRTMDWAMDVGSNLWAFPRGMKRNGEMGKNSVIWTSKYGSVITSAFEICTTDGINEKGLVANLLFLAESDYGVLDGKKPAITISAWPQYVLDNFATVEEAVNYLKDEPFQVYSPEIPGSHGAKATLHLAIADTTGDNAIFEYIKGKLVIHHGKEYTVLTNSPTYDKQLALNEYWKSIGGMTMLPGTNRAADRFARASYYINVIPQTDNTRVSIASVFSVIRNCSVPYGISTPNQPNIANTLWRTVADHKNKVYYFESALTPNVFWVNLKDMNFSVGASVKKLVISGGETYSGNTASLFKNTEPFKFLGN